MKSFSFLFIFCVALSTSCQKDIVIEDDYWTVEDPANLGFDEEGLKTALDNAKELPNFYSLLVIRNNKIAVEEYYNGKDANDLFHLRSITKNISSALVGISLEEGLIESVDSSLINYYPELITGEKEAITIRNMLNMSSGLDWVEDDEIVAVLNNLVQDPIPYTLSKELVEIPGSTFNYNSLSPHVVTNIISENSGKALRQYAIDKLLGPLGISQFVWPQDPNGEEWGGLGMQLKARDLAKFGQLYLNGGSWEGNQIVPESWVTESSQSQIQTFSETSGYSYQWYTSTNLDVPIYFGQGFGGQSLILVPNKNLMILAFQKFDVGFPQAEDQWNDFITEVFTPIYQSVN
jgi:CubicO group peptidase (beta-lactamase class C family)